MGIAIVITVFNVTALAILGYFFNRNDDFRGKVLEFAADKELGLNESHFIEAAKRRPGKTQEDESLPPPLFGILEAAVLVFLWNIFIKLVVVRWVVQVFLYGTLIVAVKRRWPLSSGTYVGDSGVLWHTFSVRDPRQPKSEHQPVKFWRMDLTDVLGEVLTSNVMLGIGIVLISYGFTKYPTIAFMALTILWLIGTASNMKDPDVSWIEIAFDLTVIFWMITPVWFNGDFLFKIDPYVFGPIGRLAIHFLIRPTYHFAMQKWAAHRVASKKSGKMEFALGD